MEVTWRIHTDLDIATAIEQDIVTLDVSVDDVQVMKVLKSLAGLMIVSVDSRKSMLRSLPRSKSSRSGLR